MKTQSDGSNNIVQKCQDRVKGLLYMALALKIITSLIGIIGMVPGLSSAYRVIPIGNFVSGVLLLLFLAAELFLMPPVGMALMCLLISVTFFLLPYGVVLFVSMMIESIILIFAAGVICYALSGIVLTFVCGFLTSIEVFSVSAPLSIAAGIGVAVAGAGGAAVYGTKAAIDKTGRSTGIGRLRAIPQFLGSLLVLLVIGWPALSASDAINGVLACKPAVIASEAFYNHINLVGSSKISEKYKAFFKEEPNWQFENNFYSSYINNGSNNIAEGEKNMIAGNNNTLAILMDGILYIQPADVSDMYYHAAYIPRKSDAMVLVGSKAFIFGHNKVFVCGSDGLYTWKKTKWTSEFEKLSLDEKYERIYDILERQNTTEKLKFSYDEVGVVAYAQRNGLLLGYDAESHTAFFAAEGIKGSVTVYRQTQPEKREELGTFTPTYSAGCGLPYYLVTDDKAIVYLDGAQIKSILLDGWKEYTMFTHPEEEGKSSVFVSLHYGDLGENGRYLVYLDDDDEIFLDSRLIGIQKVDGEKWKNGITKVSGFAANYIYSIQYEDSLISKLTFLKDYRLNENLGTSGWSVVSIGIESWNYQCFPFKKSIFDPEEAEKERKEEEELKRQEEERLNDPAVKYPAPEVASRKGRALYDKTYIATSKYATYQGPQKYFWFQYPSRLYDHVDYTLENDGADITIIFTCDNDPSYLEVSVHPLPEDAGDIKSYAEAWCAREMAELYNGLQNNFNEYDGEYRFRIQGWTEMGSGVECHVICRVDSENIMKMVLRFPNGTDKEDSAVKDFYHKKMNYGCGFGIPTKAPTIK